MKKLTALLALFLLLTLLAQGACAAVKVEIWPRISRTIQQNRNTLYGTLSPGETGYQYEIRLSELNDDDTFRNNLRDSLNQTNIDVTPLNPGHTRKALFVDMKLWHKSYSDPDFEQTYNNLNDSDSPLNPVVPLSAFIPEGTTFQNLKVFHYTQSNDADSTLTCEPVESVLHDGEPDFEDDGITFTDNVVNVSPVASDSDHYLRLSVMHFSPFVIVWDELPTDGSGSPSALTPPDVPQTGDSAPLAPWLLLLSGACALLALRRRSQRA